jgi:hypothetical protein
MLTGWNKSDKLMTVAWESDKQRVLYQKKLKKLLTLEIKIDILLMHIKKCANDLWKLSKTSITFKSELNLLIIEL